MLIADFRISLKREVKLVEIDSFLSEEVAKENCVLFVGAGLSVNAGLPTWKELMRKPAEELGLELDRVDSLDLAQYYVDSNTQGRYLLTHHVKKEIQKTSNR